LRSIREIERLAEKTRRNTGNGFVSIDKKIYICCNRRVHWALLLLFIAHNKQKIMSDFAYYTEEGLKKLKDELHEMKTVQRPRISEQIAEARDKGDLSENAEYDAAKEAQGLLEMKIAKMEELVSKARIIDNSLIDNSKVFILSRVKIKNVNNNMEMEYTLVAESEADLKEKKISVDSPIGKGLLGKKVGDIADVQTPNGIIKFEVMDIAR
jgi:transcription elongation factor GreA